MKKIYFIRHGQTEWNKLNKTQGTADIRLSSIGKDQTLKAKKRIENFNIDVIYTSDLIRAKETAELLNKDLNKNIIIDKNIREINYGLWEGKTIKEIKDVDYMNLKFWYESPEKTNFKNGENLHLVQKRALEFIETLNRDENDTILVVSHGSFLKVLILTLLNMDLNHFKNLSMGNTGISRVDFKDFNKVLTSYNDTSHLY